MFTGIEEQECPNDRGHPCEPIEAARSGDVVCSKCGCVLERVLDSHLEKRLFGEAGDEAKKRADIDPTIGMIVGLPELATAVGSVPFKPGSDLAPGGLTEKNKATAEASDKLMLFCDQLKLTGKSRDGCRTLFAEFCAKREEQSRSLRGCRTDAMLCAIIYLACRREATPRTLREISKETGVNQGDIRVAYKALQKLMPPAAGAPAATVAPKELVTRICEKLELPYQVAVKAAAIAEASAPLVEGRQPGTIAAAVVQLVCQNFGGNDMFARNEKLVSEASNMSVAAIRTVVKELQGKPSVSTMLGELKAAKPSASAVMAAEAYAGSQQQQQQQ